MTPQSDPTPDLRSEVIAVAGKYFRRYGFKTVTMDDIARELGRSKKTLYQVVANKQELIDLILDDDIECDDQAARHACHQASDAIDEMLRIALYFTDMLQQLNPAAMYDLQKYYRSSWERLDRHHNLKMIGHVRANLQRGQAEGLYRDDLDRELIAHLFIQMPQAFLQEGRYNLDGADRGAVLGQMMRYHLLGICNDAGRARLDQYLSDPHLSHAS